MLIVQENEQFLMKGQEEVEEMSSGRGHRRVSVLKGSR